MRAQPRRVMLAIAAVLLAIASPRLQSQQSSRPLMQGASRFLANLETQKQFEAWNGHVGAGVTSVRLFGGSYLVAFPTLRLDGEAAGLDRSDRSPAGRATLAFASLDRWVGRPRMLGALQVVMDAKHSTDAELLADLNQALGQDVSWLFETALDPSKVMNYRITSVRVDACSPSPCERATVDVAHDGTAQFERMPVRVDFADGQSAVSQWDGRDAARSFVFEGPARPVRATLDPERINLLDANLLDQSKELGGTTNAPIRKWIARWAVWLQDAMLAYTSIV